MDLIGTYELKRYATKEDAVAAMPEEFRSEVTYWGVYRMNGDDEDAYQHLFTNMTPQQVESQGWVRIE